MSKYNDVAHFVLEYYSLEDARFRKFWTPLIQFHNVVSKKSGLYFYSDRTQNKQYYTRNIVVITDLIKFSHKLNHSN